MNEGAEVYIDEEASTRIEGDGWGVFWEGDLVCVCLTKAVAELIMAELSRDANTRRMLDEVMDQG